MAAAAAAAVLPPPPPASLALPPILSASELKKKVSQTMNNTVKQVTTRDKMNKKVHKEVYAKLTLMHKEIEKHHYLCLKQ